MLQLKIVLLTPTLQQPTIIEDVNIAKDVILITALTVVSKQATTPKLLQSFLVDSGCSKAKIKLIT